MTLPLKPYSSMKESGVRLVGEVPAHWQVQRLRRVSEVRVSNVDKHAREGEIPVRLCNYVDVYHHDRIRPGMPFMTATARPDDVARFRLQRGDVLITKDSEAWNDIGVPALVEDADADVVSGYHLALLRPHVEQASGVFLHRAIQSGAVAYQFHVAASGVTRYGLSQSAIKSARLPVPPLLEQSAIARFLDQADRRISRYIAAKEKLIALLDENRQALVHQAVTGQIDVRTGRPYLKYKDSRVDWLGRIPSRWEVRRLRHLVIGKLTYGANVAAKHDDPTWPRYLRITDFGKDGGLRADTFRSAPPEVAQDYLVQFQDVLLARSGATVGKAFLVDQEALPACHAGYLIRARINPSMLHPALFFAFTQSRAFAKWRDSSFIISTIQNISAEKYADLPVPVPPIADQEPLLTYIAASTAAIDTAKEQWESAASLLREYRTRLIADVVTGKLDVREAAATLPDLDAAEDGANLKAELDGAAAVT